jgi:hypothetical protein
LYKVKQKWHSINSTCKRSQQFNCCMFSSSDKERFHVRWQKRISSDPVVDAKKRETKFIWRGPSHLNASLAHSAMTLQPWSSITPAIAGCCGDQTTRGESGASPLFLFIGVDVSRTSAAAAWRLLALSLSNFIRNVLTGGINNNDGGARGSALRGIIIIMVTSRREVLYNEACALDLFYYAVLCVPSILCIALEADAPRSSRIASFPEETFSFTLK